MNWLAIICSFCTLICLAWFFLEGHVINFVASRKRSRRAAWMGKKLIEFAEQESHP
jgi:hypothetical protein